MNARERVLKALHHEQPDKTPWDLDFTQPALASLAGYYDDPHLADPRFFDKWVGNHFQSVGPKGKGQFHGLEEEVAPAHSVMADVPVENLVALVDAIREQ